VFKNVIAPVQAWLLSQNRCVGCGADLGEGKVEKFKGEEKKVTCAKCGRIFILNSKEGKYRRALFNEI